MGFTAAPRIKKDFFTIPKHFPAFGALAPNSRARNPQILISAIPVIAGIQSYQYLASILDYQRRGNAFFFRPRQPLEKKFYGNGIFFLTRIYYFLTL